MLCFVIILTTTTATVQYHESRFGVREMQVSAISWRLVTLKCL